jgi:hypothetical protein
MQRNSYRYATGATVGHLLATLIAVVGKVRTTLHSSFILQSKHIKNTVCVCVR